MPSPFSHPGKGPRPASNFTRATGSQYKFSLSGVTRNQSGVALAGCTVHLFQTSTDTLIATTTSDGSGNYTFNPPNNSGTFYVVAYLPGTPDVAGTTVNTLTAA